MMRSNARSNAIKKPAATVVFDIIGYVVLSVAMLLCILPFILLISGSFTSETTIALHGYGLFPRDFSLEAYRILFKNPIDIVRAYGVSIFVTVTGTVGALLVISMCSYVISRKYFKYRNQLTFYFYFTTLFSGGLLSVYMFFVRYYGLRNNYLALILPPIMNVFYLLIMRSFMAQIPDSISESAKMDGAGDFTIYLRLIVPLSKTAFATIGLFLMLDYWNDWWNAMLYISNYRMYPLQYMLYSTLTASEAIARISRLANVSMVVLPTRALKLAMAVVATGPILMVYPFVQKYFVRGITIGAVKG